MTSSMSSVRLPPIKLERRTEVFQIVTSPQLPFINKFLFSYLNFVNLKVLVLKPLHIHLR